MTSSGRQTLIELGLCIFTVGLGVALLAARRRDWSTRFLGLAMLAAGCAGDLWIEAAVARPAMLGWAGDAVLQSVAIAAFALALLTYPAAPDRPLGPGRGELLTTAGAAAVLGAASATTTEPAINHIVLFCIALPTVGLMLLRNRGRDDLAAAERTQIRLLSGVLASAAAIAAALLVVTVLVRATGAHLLALADPTASTGRLVLRDTALLFWFSHLPPIAIAVTVLAAGHTERLYALQLRFRLGLMTATVAALVAGLFVVLHTAVDQLGPGRLPDGLAVPIAALPSALLLHPAYRQVERWVDGLLYGQRPTPYSVLAVIGSVAGTNRMDAPDLTRVAEVVGLALGARTCRLAVHRPSRPDRTYTWSAPDADESTTLVTVPVVRGGEELGSISVDRATAAGLNIHRHRLVEDIADSLGAVLDANRLGIELERQLRAVRAHAADIARSRRRLVAEMDAERRRIERDLHDGAQHHLVSLRLALGLAEHLVAAGQTGKATTAIDRVAGQIDDVESVMARTAVGVLSPLLAQRGLVAALAAELGDGEPAVTITATGVDAGCRFPSELESAVWFCCLEAVNNTRKHAPGAAVQLTLTCVPERLEFGIHDDGPGWDFAGDTTSLGRGMQNVSARVATVGGAVTVRSEPGAGTRVDGWVPLLGGPGITEMPLVDAVREVVEEALAGYADSPTAEQVRQIAAALNQPAEPGAQEPRPDRRAAVLAAGSALRALDALVRDEPPATGADAVRHRLDRIRSGTRELAEVDALDTLRSGDLDLAADDVEAAARLLGESGADARSRLGLEPDAGQPQIAVAAEQALAAWRGRASHPGTPHNVRLLAGTVVRSCEHLLHGH